MRRHFGGRDPRIALQRFEQAYRSRGFALERPCPRYHLTYAPHQACGRR